MDLRSLQVKNSNQGLFSAKICSFSHRSTWVERPFSCNLGKISSFRIEDGRLIESRIPKYKVSPCRSLIFAMAKKNRHNPSSSGNGDESTPGKDGSKGKNHGFGKLISDWRTFRAHLVAKEQVQKKDTEIPGEDADLHHSKPLGLKWAHPIPVPEAGCVLVATEKLDGVRTFERTVVLLLRSGNRSPYEGPFGVVINRPLNKRIKQMKPSNLDLATTFADCSLYFGGPLEASMFLLRNEANSQFPGFEQVIPGLSFGARNSLVEAAGLVKKGMLNPEDFRFFVGYAGWQFDQLREEIESDYWFVAACSANLILGGSPDSSSEGLWEEILQLMGGHYSELSRKPKRDSQ